MTKINIRKFSLALIGSLLMATIAHAEYRQYSYHEMHGYDDELQHCVELLRPNLRLGENEQAKYLIEDISLRGAWYSFKISASVFLPDGAARIDNLRVTCKSNRWIESAELKEPHNSTEKMLIVTNTSELLSYIALARNIPPR